MTRVSQSTQFVSTDDANQVLNFQVSERTAVSTCSRGWSPGKGGNWHLRYFSKGSQKHLLAWGMCWVIEWLRPSFLLLWKSRKYDSNICSRCMTSKFRMFNLCVLKRIQWSARAREVSWTSCSMLGGLSLALSWYFYNAWAKVIRRVQQRHSFHDSTCAIEPTDTPSPQNSKKCQGMYNVTFTFWWDRNPDPVFAKNGQHHESWWFDTWKWIWSCQHLFLSQPQKSPDISLLQGFLRHGEFR